MVVYDKRYTKIKYFGEPHKAARGDFEIVEDSYIDYPEGGCEYHLLAVKKK